MGDPKFIQKAVSSGGRATVANVAADGTGTYATIAVCDNPVGLRIDSVHFKALATTAANKLRIFLQEPDSGPTRLIHEIAVTAVTMSNTAASWASIWVPDPPLVLQEGYTLKFAPANALAAGFDATVTSGGELD